MSTSALLFPVALLIFALTLAFDRRLLILHAFTCWWGFHYIRICPFWAVEIEGREKIPRGASLLCANHQSLADVLILFGLKRHFKWVSKEEIFRIPFIGWNMRLNGYVALRRGDAKSVREMMGDCRRHLERGSAIFMFPEGSRSRGGELKPFRHGAFNLAVDTSAPIVPIVVEGTKDILPKSGWVFSGGRHTLVRIRVLDPVRSVGLKPAALSDQVRQLIHRELSDMRKI